ncbi:MAG: hypothetical protein AABZ47_03455 [Planctomycetota bacterium]
MGWRIATRLLVLALCAGSGTRAGDIEDPPTMSIRIVAKNGVALPAPSLFVEASPGDILTTEIFLRCWSNGMHSQFPGVQPLLKSYQATIPYATYFTGSKGNILPKDFADTTEFPDGNCNNTSTDPFIQNTNNFFVATTRADYALGNQVFVASAGSGMCDYRVAGAICLFGCPGVEAVCPPTEQKYAGTLILKVSDDAIGTFRLCLDDRDISPDHPIGPDNSSFRPAAATTQNHAIIPVRFECATIRIVPQEECDRTISSSSPPSGSIVAGQPHGLDNAIPAGLQSVVLGIQDGDLSCLTSNDFLVSVFPDGPHPSVSEVQITGPQTVQLTLSGPIPAGKSTRITLADPTPNSVSIGYLPGDVLNDGYVDTDDVEFLIQYLTGTNCPVLASDIDRSGALSVLDLAREVDLLIGAGAFEPWLGAVLPPLDP